MAQIIRSKKFRLAGWILLLLGEFAFAQTSVPMPKVETVGIIPPQWVGDETETPELLSAKQHIGVAFGQVVRESARFRVLNDHLVRDLWSTPAGRAELANDYEMHAFSNLLVALSGDTVRMESRLLGPNMEIYLAETESLSAESLAMLSDEERVDLLRNLIFRVFNRLPIDATVISVQGRYLTLSGGLKQGVRLDERFDIIRPSITAAHPANGSWISFASKVMGKATIVDVNELTSVAQLDEQAFEDAVTVGDGVKIYHLRGRSMFAPKPKVDSSPIRDGVPAIPTVDEHRQREKKELVPKRSHGSRSDNQMDPGQSEKLTRPQDTVAENTPEPEDDDPYAEDSNEPGLVGSILKKFRGLNLRAGFDTWSASGAATASSAMAPWLFNYISGSSRLDFIDGFDLQAGGALLLGSTSNGSYYGMDLEAKMVYLIQTEGIISFYRIGGIGRYETRNYQSETFGGGDFLIAGGVAGVEGRVEYMDLPFEWLADLALIPIGVGQAGISGSKETAAGVFGYEFLFELVMPSESNIDWGGALIVNSFDIQAGDGVSTSSMKLLAQARYKF